MANEEHLSILRQGVEIWNHWRKDNPEIRPDLSGANLRNANLSKAILSFADLSFAHLRGADLRGADLRGADLSEADLRRADLRGADLRDADLSEADLRRAHLSRAHLSRAHLSEAEIGYTTFVDVDLSETLGLETIKHQGPSSIGIDTIYRSKGNIPHKFLLDAGVPKDAIGYLLSLAGKAIDFYSCFISYSSHDQAFAERLRADLQAKGVRCWLASEDMKPGAVIISEIDNAIRLHDKLLLVLSQHAVASKWVRHEVESALTEEMQTDREGGVLFPIRLDNAVMETKVTWADTLRKNRHIGDFTQWKDHDAYQKTFDRLLRDLKLEAQK